MAFLIPENARSDKTITAARRRAAGAFAAGLPDDTTVWYEPPFDVDGERPEFVIVDPTIGVVVVAVFEDDLLGALRAKLRVEVDGHEREVVSPLDRANRFGLRLRKEIAANPRLAMVPVSGVAAFPGIERRQADALGVDTVADLEHCLFKADIDAAARADDEAVLHRRLLRIAQGGVGEPLDDPALGELRAIIHPEVVIRPPAEQGSLFTSPRTEFDVVRVMDRKQERLAKGLGSGHRVVRGVAGSGKTLVLVSRARLLARLLPGRLILVTCFTRSLASQLHTQLADHENVEVVHLHALMHQVLRDLGRELPKKRGGNIDWDAMAAPARKALREAGRPRYRAVLVDEAQDLDTDALAFCAELLESVDPDQQDLVIVADSAQNIFRRNFRWKDAGIRAQGRTQILRVNYRNTRQILDLAHTFLIADPELRVEGAADAIDEELVIVPPESAERDGPPPVVSVTNDIDDEIAAVVDQVRGWYSPRSPARSIAVLLATERVGERGRRIVDALDAASVATFWVTDPERPDNRDRAGSADEPVIVSTIHSAKGLEFPQVVVCGLPSTATRADDARKLVYVGLTRAVDELVVVTERTHPFARELANAAANQK